MKLGGKESKCSTSIDCAIVITIWYYGTMKIISPQSHSKTQLCLTNINLTYEAIHANT